MEFTFTMLNLVWLFVTANAFLLGFVTAVILLFVFAANGEKWLDRLIEKHPWIMEERDMSIFAIIRDIRAHRKSKKA